MGVCVSVSGRRRGGQCLSGGVLRGSVYVGESLFMSVFVYLCPSMLLSLCLLNISLQVLK